MVQKQIQGQNEAMQEMRRDMEKLKRETLGQSNPSFDHMKGKRWKGRFLAQHFIDPSNVFHIDQHESPSLENNCECIHAISKLRNGKFLPNPFDKQIEDEKMMMF